MELVGDAREPFYLSEDQKMIAASIQVSGQTIEAGPPAVLFEGAPETFPSYFRYQPTAAGQRFLAIVDARVWPRLTVVLNWRARSRR